MGVFNQQPAQKLSSAALSNSFLAADATINAVIGSGVMSGLVITSTGIGTVISCSTGVAVAGHLVALTAVSTMGLPAGTWDIYLCQPVFTVVSNTPVAGSYPGTNGVDAGVLTAVATGTSPAALGAMLATVVSTGAAITSVNSAPAGRNALPGPAPAGTRSLYPAYANFTTQPNGAATSFTLVQTPNPVGSLVVFKNGVVIDPTLYSLAGAVVTFPAAPLNTDKLSASMHY